MKGKTPFRAPKPPPAESLVAQVERRAREDFEWTCAHLLKIKTEVSGLAPLTLIPTQLYLHRRYAQPAWDEGVPLALVILKSRRARVSTFWEAWFFTRARFYPLQSVLIAAHLDSSVNALYEMVERFHQHFPAELQPPVKRLNRKELAYEGLESAVKVAAARYMDISRGQLINHCHLAEAPYLPDPETVLSGLSESIPRRGRSSLVLEGTANGQGTWFHQFWKDVGRLQGTREFGGRHWQRVFIPWYAHPDYMLPVPKDFEFTPEERDRQRRFKLMPEQLVWYRMALQEMEVLHPGRGQDLMSQENAECVVGETRISTEQGIIQIQQGATAQWCESGKIQRWGPQPEAPIYELMTTQGRSLRATWDHPVKLESGAYRYLGELQVGDRIQLRPPRFSSQTAVVQWQPIRGATTTVEITPEWALFLGYFLGDGCWYHTEMNVACDTRDTDVIDDVTTLVEQLIGPAQHKVVARVKGRKGTTYVYATGRDDDGRSAALSIFRRLGVIVTTPDYYYKRHVAVPECLWRSPREQIASFLSGLFEADGSASQGRVRFYTKHHGFAQEIQLLLLGFGINVAITPTQKVAGNRKVYTGYAMEFREDAAVRFIEQIGFRSVRKRHQSEEILRAIAVRQTRPRNRQGWRLEPLGMVDVVKAVEGVDYRPTYAMSIESTSEFSANGILTHNTAEEAFLSSGSVIFPSSIMAHVKDQQRDPIKGFRFEHAGLNEDSAPVWRLVPDRLERAPLLVWEEPDTKYQYTLGVDVSSGVGRHESTIVVIRMPGFKQVAEWGDAETTSADLAGLVACVARYYAVSPQNRNGPIVNVDVTGGWGMDTNNRLLSNYAGEPLQLYVWELFDRLVPAPVRPSSRTGWLFTYVSKNILIATALNLLKEQLCDLPSLSIQEDLAGLQEEHLNQRSVVEMSGSDRAVGWLLAIVAAWRKIARWSWPTTRGAAVKQDAVEERDRMIETVMYSATHDTTVQEIYQPRGMPASSTAGEKDVPWQIQW